MTEQTNLICQAICLTKVPINFFPPFFQFICCDKVMNMLSEVKIAHKHSKIEILYVVYV